MHSMLALLARILAGSTQFSIRSSSRHQKNICLFSLALNPFQHPISSRLPLGEAHSGTTGGKGVPQLHVVL